jgi:membrane-associated protein
VEDWLRHALESMGPWSIFVSAFIGPYLFPAAGELAIVAAVGLGVSVPLVFVLGVAGGMASDQLAFGVGRFGGRRAAQWMITPERRAQLDDRMHRHAVWALVGGRMLTGVRTWLAILAGVAHMRWARFSLLNLVGCMLWAGVFIAIGAIFGATTDVEAIVERLLHWAWPIFFLILGYGVLHSWRMRRRRRRNASPDAQDMQA